MKVSRLISIWTRRRIERRVWSSHFLDELPFHHLIDLFRECTANDSVAALIKLTPLDASNELFRGFALNPARDHIDVGRASKNETKGLVAAKENAWFDSPIMSRQHARFTMSKAVKVRAHSNFPGDRRLV